MAQNRSHAVMSQRFEPDDSADDFPTPPWATRALIVNVFGNDPRFGRSSCLEPACGAGHMVRALKAHFGKVSAFDAYDYGQNSINDFLTCNLGATSVDWVITNPPFRLGQKFVIRGLHMARKGVAMLVRTSFIESVGRYRGIFELTPPTVMAQFVERVPMVKGRLDRHATTATSYAWLVWEKASMNKECSLQWIPPCRKELEREGDYA